MKLKAEAQKFAFPGDFPLLVGDKEVRATQRAFHEEIEIKYCYEGEMCVAIGEDVFFQRAGEISFAAPFEIHTNILTGAEPARYYLLMIGVDFLREIGISREQVLKIKPAGHKIRDERLSGIVTRIAAEYAEKKPYYRQAIKGLLTEFFAVLMRTVTAPSGGEKPADHSAVARALEKIYLDYGGKLTLQDLADACYLSKAYLCRLFKRETGKTPVDFITDYRLRVAETLLLNTDKSCAEIARTCGFEEESYFTRRFRKKKGVTPTAFRKSAV